jgi:hypothetical protein
VVGPPGGRLAWSGGSDFFFDEMNGRNDRLTTKREDEYYALWNFTNKPVHMMWLKDK